VERPGTVAAGAGDPVRDRPVQPVVPSKTEKRSAPLGVIAEIMFTECRAPVLFTTGVRPTGAQVAPEWWSERMPASSAT
jgi:hypothetical protein